MRARSLRSRFLPTAAAAALALAAGAGLRAENFVRVGYGEGSPGEAGVQVVVLGMNDVPIHGYSLALAYPRDVLSLRSFSVAGSHVAALAPQFAASSIDDDLGIATLGVIINYSEPLGSAAIEPTPPDSRPRIIARLVFDVRPGARGGFHPIELIDGLGSPAIYNRFSTAGASIEPRLRGGRFFVDGGDVLTLESKFAIAGATPSIVLAAHAAHPEPLAGYSVTFQYDCGVLELLEATLAQTSVGIELGSRGLIDFFQTDVDDTIGDDRCRSRTAVIFEVPELFEELHCPTPTLAPWEEVLGQTILRCRFSVPAAAAAGTEYREIFLDDAGPTSLNNTFLADRCPNAPVSILPRLVHGRIYFSQGRLTGRVVEALDGSPQRGAEVIADPGGASAVTAADGSFVLPDMIPGDYSLRVRRSGCYLARFDGLFVTGGATVDDAGDLPIYRIPAGGVPGPGSFRRGDANTDGTLNVSDGISVLNFLFSNTAVPRCLDALDTDDSGRVDIADGIGIFLFLFLGAVEPRAPGPEICGRDLTDDALDCSSFPPCAP